MIERVPASAALYSPRLDDEDDDDKEKKPQTPTTVENKLFDARFVMITGPINQEMAKDVVARLFAMASVSDDPITVLVSSPGGHVESGDMIHDTIKYIKPRVRVLGSGWVASAGALIYVAAEKQDRYSLPNTRFLLHQPAGGAGGPAADIAIQAKEIKRMHERLNKIFADATEQKLEKIEQDTDRDFWLSAEEAVAYGLVGKIVNSVDEVD